MNEIYVSTSKSDNPGGVMKDDAEFLATTVCKLVQSGQLLPPFKIDYRDVGFFGDYHITLFHIKKT